MCRSPRGPGRARGRTVTSRRAVQFVLTDGDGGTSLPATVTLNLGPSLELEWPVPNAIVYGTPLAAVQLNATAREGYYRVRED